MSDLTTRGIREVQGRRGGARSTLLFAAPAVIASIVYMGPGNFATNIQAGARYGYTLLWVVLAANLIAMLFQGLSAKLGIITNRNLAELCREHFSPAAVWAMWAVSEIAAMATDLAEFLGGAIGLALLFHTPLMAGMAVTAVVPASSELNVCCSRHHMRSDNKLLQMWLESRIWVVCCISRCWHT